MAIWKKRSSRARTCTTSIISSKSASRAPTHLSRLSGRIKSGHSGTLGYPREIRTMKSAMIALVVFVGATALYGQNPLTTELKQGYAGVKGNVMKAAEDMP